MKKFFTRYLFELTAGGMLVTASIVSFAAKSPVSGWTALIMAAVYGLLTVAASFIFRGRGKTDDRNTRSLSSLTVSFLTKLDLPALLIDFNGSVCWSNTGFASLEGGRGVRFGTESSALFDGELTVESLTSSADTGSRIPIEAGGRYYALRAYPITASGKKYWLCIGFDETELTRSRDYIAKHNPAVMYIVVDNYSELAQGMKDNYRTDSAKVSKLLNEWADGFSGLIKEFERDKYICVFDEMYVSGMQNADFDIIDRVSAVTGDDGGAPLTISIGLAAIDGSFEEKEEAAMLALQLALQKGGAQAVVRTREGTSVYGARVRAAKKDSKGPSRNTAFLLVSQIEKSSNVIIMGHKNPDFDSIASALGIARLAITYGKRPYIIVSRNDTGILPALHKLAPLEEYRNVFIDDVYAQELLTPSTLLVITDVNNVGMFASQEVYGNASRVAIIDHHIKKEEFERQPLIEFIDPSASSASELVSEMLEEKLPAGALRREEAVLLFAGILLDTQNFTRGTGVRTFGASFYLRGAGADPGEARELFKNDLGEYIKLASIERNIYVYRNTRVAISFFDGIGTDDDYRLCCTVADRMLSINGVIASFVLCQVGDAVRITARSGDDGLNVGSIMESYGGGGRFDAAACRIENITTENAIASLEKTIDDFFAGKIRRNENENTAS